MALAFPFAALAGLGIAIAAAPGAAVAGLLALLLIGPL